MSERSIKIVREYNFDPKEVIAGLNGYYESDKCNSYITIKRNDVEGPAYLTAALYLSALIEWLREDHDIFYRPGMTLDQVEAARSAAKMCGLRAHIKDELSKRGLWCTADEDIPELVDTLFKAYDECSEARDRNRKEVVKLSKENRELKEGVCEDIMSYIRQEASRNGFKLPEEIDNEPLTIKRVFHDLLELLRKRDTEIKETRKKHWNDLRDIYKALGRYDTCDNTDGFAKAVKARAEYLESLSRNAEREARKAVNDQLKKDTDYTADALCDISDRIHEICNAKGVELDDAFLYDDDYTWEDLVGFLCEEIRKLKKEVEDAKKETKRKCYWYLWEALKKLSPECDALKIDCYENLVDRIFYEMSLINDNCKRCYRKHTTEKFDYIRRTNKAEEEVKNLRSQIDRLKGLINTMNEEVKDM